MLSSYITLYQPLLIYKNNNIQRWLVFAVAVCIYGLGWNSGNQQLSYFQLVVVNAVEIIAEINILLWRTWWALAGFPWAFIEHWPGRNMNVGMYITQICLLSKQYGLKKPLWNHELTSGQQKLAKSFSSSPQPASFCSLGHHPNPLGGTQ